MNKFQRKESKAVRRIINNSFEKRRERTFRILKAEARYIILGKRFNEKTIETQYFKKIRRQYRKEVKK